MDGTGLRRLTHGAGEESAPASSPDGRQVAYTVYRDRRDAQIHGVDLVSGKSVAIGARPAEGQENSVQWSPDGSRIAYGLFKDDLTHIHTRRSDGTDKPLLTQGKSCNNDTQCSSDSKQILFLSLRNGSARQAIYAMNADGSAQREWVGSDEAHCLAR